MTGAQKVQDLEALLGRLPQLPTRLGQLPAVQAGECGPEAKFQALVAALQEPIIRTAARLPPMARSFSPVVPGRKRAPGGGRQPSRVREVLASDVARAMEACGLRVDRTHGAGIEDASLYFQVLHVVLGIAFPPGSKGAEPEVATSANYGRLVAARRRWKPTLISCDATPEELRRHGISPRPPGQLKP